MLRPKVRTISAIVALSFCFRSLDCHAASRYSGARKLGGNSHGTVVTPTILSHIACERSCCQHGESAWQCFSCECRDGEDRVASRAGGAGDETAHYFECEWIACAR